MIWHDLEDGSYEPSTHEAGSSDDDEFVLIEHTTKDPYIELQLYWDQERTSEYSPERILAFETIDTSIGNNNRRQRGSIGMLLELKDEFNKMSEVMLRQDPRNHFGCSSIDDVRTDSAANMRLAANWLNHCIQNHSTCRIGEDSKENRIWPKRLFDVQDVQNPRLVTVTGQPYLTLSYCWGEKGQLQTRRDNILQHKDTLPLSDLPQTHRDAMAVCKALGFRYIWIDALCIIQDSDEDKEQEIANMGRIYQGSTLTIDANAGNNVHSGLFVGRSPLWYSPCKLDITITLQEETMHEAVYAYPYMAKARLCSDLRGDLYTRGWVLQEELLSARHLVFGEDMMSWCCTDCRASEVCAAPTDHTMGPVSDLAQLRRWICASAQMSPSLQSLTGRKNHFDSWYRVIEEFSTRCLKYESDTLKALEGIAQCLQRELDCRYLCGLWEDDFQRGLAWTARHTSQSEGEKSEALDQWSVTAPSWSWVSCPGTTIEFHTERGSNIKQVLFLGVQWRMSNVTGSISTTRDHGVLQLTGALKKARMRIVRGSDGYVKLDDIQTGKEVGDGFLDHVVDDSIWLVDSSQLRPISCLLILALIKDHWDLLCLMLRPTHSGGNEYNRVGMMRVRDVGWFGKLSKYWYSGDIDIHCPLPAEFVKCIETINLV